VSGHIGGATRLLRIPTHWALHGWDDVVVKVAVVVATAFFFVSAMAARIERGEVAAVLADLLLDMHHSLHYVGEGTQGRAADVLSLWRPRLASDRDQRALS